MDTSRANSRGTGIFRICELQRPEWRRSRWSFVLQKAPREVVLDLQGKDAGQDDQSLYGVLENHLDLIFGETVSAQMRSADQRGKLNELGPGTIISAPFITKSLAFHPVIPAALLIPSTADSAKRYISYLAPEPSLGMPLSRKGSEQATSDAGQPQAR
ncbi:hypothetical protein FPANT_12933, partial [Fusarium pseudoanthophilum]